MIEVIKTLAASTGKSASEQYLSTASGDNGYSSGSEGNLMTTVNMIINVALGVIGLVAVVMIILGGVQYTTSSGDAAKVKKAKDTIMYGIIGLVVALLAFAIVNFVLGTIFKQ